MPDPSHHRLPLLVVAAVIAREDGRILIAQRGPGRRNPGEWEFPGGKVEEGEDPRAALVRECDEEMGCPIEVGAPYETIFVVNEKHAVLLLFYTARLRDGDPRPIEHSDLRWVTPQEMAAYELLEADRGLPAQFVRRFPHFQPAAR